MGVVTITSNLRAWLQYQLGPSWHVLIWFLGLSGVIGFFANLRAIIELFALVLMGIYLVTDPLFDRVLSKFGEDNQDHVVSNILIYVLASLILTLVFTVMKRRSILRQLEAAEAEIHAGGVGEVRFSCTGRLAWRRHRRRAEVLV
jgi:hypothetical protein